MTSQKARRTFSKAWQTFLRSSTNLTWSHRKSSSNIPRRLRYSVHAFIERPPVCLLVVQHALFARSRSRLRQGSSIHVATCSRMQMGCINPGEAECSAIIITLDYCFPGLPRVSVIPCTIKGKGDCPATIAKGTIFISTPDLCYTSTVLNTCAYGLMVC